MALSQFVFFLTLSAVTAKSIVHDEHSLIGAKAIVSPIAKVLDLIEGITDEVKTEARKEKASFNAFKNWCSKNTRRLNNMENRYDRKIALKAANVDEATLKALGLHKQYGRKMDNVEHYNKAYWEEHKSLTDMKASWASESSKHDKDSMLVRQALKALKNSKGRVNGAAAFLQLPDVAEYVAMADAMGLVKTKKQKAIAASLLQGKGKVQQEPDREGYGFHEGSADVIDLVTELQGEMAEIHSQRQATYEKAVTTSQQILNALDKKLGNNKRTAAQTHSSEERKKKQIGRNKEALIRYMYELQDTKQVLKEITATCEARTADFKDRAEMRSQEIEALITATAVLSNAKEAAGKQSRVLLQATPVTKKTAPTKILAAPLHVTMPADSNSSTKENVTAKSLFFLQELLSKSQQGSSFLGRAAPHEEPVDDPMEDTKKRALGVLRDEGRRLQSPMLIAMAARSKGDPFTKVKGLIRNLIERLSQEALTEASKKGFCDAQVAEAEQERDTRFQEAKRLNTEIVGLEARSDALRESIIQSSKIIKETEEALKEVRDEFAEFKEDLMVSLKEQKEAREQIREGTLILKTFYAHSAKAAGAGPGLLQESKPPSRAEKMRMDMLGSMAEGPDGITPSEARQGGMKDIFGLLAALESDFDREVHDLETSFKKAQKDMIETTRSLEERRAAKEVQRKSDTKELKDTGTAITMTTSDMETSVNLLDSALKQLELLKPTCIDTGMSYQERVQKRKDEIVALKKALDILRE